MDTTLRENIKILKESFNGEYQVDYAGVSSQDDFNNYEDIITFKYKMINSVSQLSKVRDFIEAYRSELDYDWYVKIRPEVKLLQPLDFTKYARNAMNARARVYVGPRKIEHGFSVGDPNGEWPSFYKGQYSDVEGEIILDDHIFIFDHSVINTGFYAQSEPYPPERQDEHYHTRFWISRKITMNPTGIDMIFTRPNDGLKSRSANVNM
jgi:hypothetical protein